MSSMPSSSHLFTISIVVPVRNERESIPQVFCRIQQVFTEFLPHCELEIIFLDNCSRDGSQAQILQLVNEFPNVTGVLFEKNYGLDPSILFGVLLSRGDAVIELDADLQDPPEALPEMIQKWRDGADLVIASRERQGDSLLLNWMRNAFFLLNRLNSRYSGAGNFMLMDRSIIAKLPGKLSGFVFFRNLVSSRATNVQRTKTQRAPREVGRSKYNLKRLLWFGTLVLLSDRKFIGSLILAVLLLASALAGFRLPWQAGTVFGSGLLLLIAHFNIQRRLNFDPKEMQAKTHNHNRSSQ